MGASQFRTVGRGQTIREAYNEAVEAAREEYGHQEGYSGEINSTHSLTDATKDFQKSGLSREKFIEKEYETCSKGYALGICIEEPKGNTNKVKSQVEHIIEPGTKKWILRYAVYDYDNLLKSFNTKGDAVKYARAYTEKTTKRTSIEMKKTLEKGSSKVATVTYKQSTQERPGKWIFFGWAAC